MRTNDTRSVLGSGVGVCCRPGRSGGAAVRAGVFGEAGSPLKPHYPVLLEVLDLDVGQPDLEVLEASLAWVATLEGVWGFACVMRTTGGYVLQVPGFQALAPGTSAYSSAQVKDLTLVRGALPESIDGDWVVVIGRDYFDSFPTKKPAAMTAQALHDQGRDAYIFRRADYDRYVSPRAN